MIYYQKFLKTGRRILFAALLLLPSSFIKGQQKISIGVHADPVVSWFGTDIDAVKNSGARAGFNFGLSFIKYFSPNYAFSTGLNLISSGGRLTCEDTTILELNSLKYKQVTVRPDEAVIYKIQYLSVPLGLKLKTNQIGYLTFFSDVGIDPKVVVGGKVEIPPLDISGENATNELRYFNLAYHIKAGIEYGIGGNTAVVLGLGFENNFLDVTKENGDQPKDNVTQRLISFRLGVIF
jgi:hypothetical protein